MPTIVEYKEIDIYGTKLNNPPHFPNQSNLEFINSSPNTESMANLFNQLMPNIEENPEEF